MNRDPFAKDSSGMHVVQIGRLRHFYVHPDYRKQAVGRAVLEAVASYAKDYFKRVRLYTDRGNAIQFYIKMGYRSFVDEHRKYQKDQVVSLILDQQRLEKLK